MLYRLVAPVTSRLLAVLVVLSILPLAHAGAGADLKQATVEQVDRGVVRIFNFSAEGMSYGSGFFLNADGDIATNNHVVQGARLLLVLHKHGDEVIVRLGRVINTDPDLDIALVHVNRVPDITPFTLCVAEPPPLQSVWSCGFPSIADDETMTNKMLDDLFRAEATAGTLTQLLQNPQPATIDRVVKAGLESKDSLQPSFKGGDVSKMVTRPWDNRNKPLRMVFHTAGIAHGNSGGPLFDANGNLVGINTARGEIEPDTGQVTFKASFAVELANYAKANGVAIVPTTVLPTKPWFTLSSILQIALLVSILLVALIVAIIVMQKRKGSQSLTQLIRQHGTSEVRKMLHIPVQVAPPTQLARSRSPIAAPLPSRSQPSAANRYSLSGAAADGRRIRVEFTDAMLRDAGGKLTIGRKQELVHLHIDDRSLSRQHAAITQRGHGIYLEDRESANGTWVNDDKLGAEYEAIKLKPGDRVRLGSLDLTFRTET